MSSKTVSKNEAEMTMGISSSFSGRRSAAPSAVADKRRKHVVLNQPRLKKAQELLGAKTESETIERALERVIADAENNRDAWTAHERFIKGLINEEAEIKDVFGRLER